MKRQVTLVLPQKISDQLRDHLFPGDGLEAAALLLCTQVGKRRSKLLGREIIAVPYLHCTRRPDSITWPGEYVEAAIDRAAPRGDIVIAVHSHPGGFYAFSDIDDKSDLALMSALQQGTFEIDSGQVGAGQDGIPEIDITQIGHAGEIKPRQVSATQI